MPEGHTIHREARLQSRHFTGQAMEVWSPQGRFSSGARLLDGHRIEAIEPWGKHLFYEWDHGVLLHVHLGLFGRFRRHTSEPPPPTDGTRLAISGNGATLYLSGPTVCEIVEPDHRDDVIGRLGPDPLRPETHTEALEHLVTSLRRRTVPIASALLDQSVIAGIGNVYRAEILFLCHVDPSTSSRDVPDDKVAAIWEESVTQLRRGEKSGRIVTTHPGDVGRSRRSDIQKGERTYVYKRQGQPCRRCGTVIRRDELAGRKIWWCPSCQSAG